MEETSFAKFKDVSLAFFALFITLQKVVKKCGDFMIIKTACIANASEKLSKEIKKTWDINSLFQLFAENKNHCNWLNVRFLEVIVTASGNNQLTRLVDSYKNTVDSKMLREVWDHFPYHPVRTKCHGYSVLQTTFDGQDPDSVTVEKFKGDCEPYLIKDTAGLISVTEENSNLRVTWLIPTNTVYKTFLSALLISEESRLDSYLQISDWVVHHPLHVLQNLHKKHC